ncbi:hypothetical protein L596_028241 [Steinernema carpocapsae]|uniref:Uncharacterized protein n=1 Tax=Steinernema carpocapsae TaxID=34508 RepID=A0A4U5LXV1_STECR|nr:hypothetical protein L596_028241 [Steinernema carpocapsae]
MREFCLGVGDVAPCVAGKCSNSLFIWLPLRLLLPKHGRYRNSGRRRHELSATVLPDGRRGMVMHRVKGAFRTDWNVSLDDVMAKFGITNLRVLLAQLHEHVRILTTTDGETVAVVEKKETAHVTDLVNRTKKKGKTKKKKHQPTFQRRIVHYPPSSTPFRSTRGTRSWIREEGDRSRHGPRQQNEEEGQDQEEEAPADVPEKNRPLPAQFHTVPLNEEDEIVDEIVFTIYQRANEGIIDFSKNIKGLKLPESPEKLLDRMLMKYDRHFIFELNAKGIFVNPDQENPMY